MTNWDHRVLYPTAAQRQQAPKEVRDADAGLADDYDEAVVCEPCSGQASVYLLGRCAERILVAKCRGGRGGAGAERRDGSQVA